MKLAGALAALLAATGAFAGRNEARPPRPNAALTLAWEYRGIPAGMSVYEPGPGADTLALWHTKNAARLSDIPAGAELKDGVVKIAPGTSRRLLLVYRNPGDMPVRFFASPHHVHPDESSLGFEFACLCMNHVYTAPPGGYWWRLVELKLDYDFAAPSLEVKHVLLAPSQKKTL